jgi:spore germination protein (amino acid permease)
MARFIMFLFALCLPGFYIAFTSYNIEMIPTRLLTILLGNQEQAIFPVYFEAFLMMGVVEAVRMMLLSMQNQLGATIALFAGISLIGAGIAGNIIGIPITIIVTLTIISSYAIPNIDLRYSVRILQFFTMIISTFLGLFGFAVAFFYICVHLATLKSFGIPYMAPLAPIEGSAWGQTIFRQNSNTMPQDETYQPLTNAKEINNARAIADSNITDNLDKLSPKILATVLIVTFFEVEFAAVPRAVVSIAGEDAWLSLLIGGIIVIGSAILLIKLASLFPREGFFTYSRKVWGKALGSLINFAYIAFWFLYVSTLLQDTAAINQGLFLPTTPSIVPLLVVIIAVIGLVSYGVANIVRLFQLLLPFIVVPLIIILFLIIRPIQFTNFLPMLSNGMLPILKGAFVFAGAWQGLEVILFLAPFISNIHKAYIPTIIGISLFIFLLIAIATGTIGIMGVENVKETLLPSITMLSLIELPGFPVERFGLLLTLPMILGFFTTLAIYIYLITFPLIGLFKFKHRKLIISLVALLTLTTIYLIPDQSWTLKLRQIVLYLTVLFILVIPLFTLILAKVRGQGAGK